MTASALLLTDLPSFSVSQSLYNFFFNKMMKGSTLYTSSSRNAACSAMQRSAALTSQQPRLSTAATLSTPSSLSLAPSSIIARRQRHTLQHCRAEISPQTGGETESNNTAQRAASTSSQSTQTPAVSLLLISSHAGCLAPCQPCFLWQHEL